MAFEIHVIYIEEKNRTAIRENVMAGVRPLMSSDRCPKQFKDLIPKCWGTIPQTRPDFDGMGSGARLASPLSTDCHSRDHQDIGNDSSILATLLSW